MTPLEVRVAPMSKILDLVAINLLRNLAAKLGGSLQTVDGRLRESIATRRVARLHTAFEPAHALR
jgi:hypothetical protein